MAPDEFVPFSEIAKSVFEGHCFEVQGGCIYKFCDKKLLMYSSDLKWVLAMGNPRVEVDMFFSYKFRLVPDPSIPKVSKKPGRLPENDEEWEMFYKEHTTGIDIEQNKAINWLMDKVEKLEGK